ncbi:MAG: Tex family protein [Pseudoramibacter sp.]
MTTVMETLKREFKLPETVLTRTIELMDGGNTIPFIARYRKEVTGNMSDVTLRKMAERLAYLRKMEARREAVTEQIKAQGKWNEDLAAAFAQAATMQEIEDLYLPYKKKRRTRAMKAREAGFAPLAEAMLLGRTDRELKALADKLAEQNSEATSDAALQGAVDIAAETVSERADLRKQIRSHLERETSITSEVKPEYAGEKTPYLDYYHHTEAVAKIANHRVLAINRGEREKVLTVKIEPGNETMTAFLNRHAVSWKMTAAHQLMAQAIADAYKRLMFPAISREIRKALTERAEASAIRSFGINLKKLLLGRPLKGKTVMGFDPGFRNGCKIAVLSPTGKLLATSRIFLTRGRESSEKEARKLIELIQKTRTEVIAIGNGTASRESEQFVAEVIRKARLDVQYTIVSEAGASIYSASPLAAEEYPDVDVSLRGAISIGGRLQDPMSELVKIEPEHIGIGQYQLDVDQKALKTALDGVVEDAVNRVGVDVNRASKVLLKHVSGITETVAQNIVDFRDENGPIKSRKALLKIKGMGQKRFEQCAGFLRIEGGTEPLDRTAVHPESYPIAKALLKAAGADETALIQSKTSLADALQVDPAPIQKAFGVGKWTLEDIVEALSRPGRDPRDSAPPILLKKEVLSISDLKPDMELTGTVRNVVDFGAFVDIGVHQDGLVHVSEISDRYIEDPTTVLSVGDVVTVRVLSVDLDRNRISLSMRL